MDIESFRTAIARFTALPAEEVERALQVAQQLNNDEREDLFDRLSDMNDELAEGDERRQKAIERMEQVTHSLEQAVRQFEEVHEKQDNLEQIETKLSHS